MRRIRLFALAGVSMMSVAAPAMAQSAPATGDAEAVAPGDIIVQARRRDERLQDVPKVVNVVSSEDLRKNNIQKFEDVQSIVPGLDLQDAHNGLTQNANMRGASFDVDSGLQSPTIQFYLNDGNIQSSFMFQSMYDIGQLEVLRGPQGTLRGRSAPSGAITLTTRLPDMDQFGGFAEATALSGPGGQKYDAALNVPIIKEKLAVRLAGTISDSDGDGTHPVNTALYPNGPFDRTWSQRVSVRAMPIDSLEINLMYQRLVNRADTYLQTESTCLIDPSQPCGTGPLVHVSDRLSTVNGQRFVYQQMNIWNARLDWHVAGQKLSYVGSYALSHLYDEEPGDAANFFDTAGNSGPRTTYLLGSGTNYFGTANPYQKVAVVRSQYQSHEVRLASEERIAHLFDYIVGYNTVDAWTNAIQGRDSAFETYMPQREVTLPEPFDNGPKEVSWFGNLTVHPTEKLEISGGARYIIDKFYAPALAAIPGFGYQRATDTIWTASASYHFTPDILGYVNAGSSFRTPGVNLGLAFAGGAYPSQYFLIKPEQSKSYEVGLKTQLFDRKLTFNIDYYHQDFTNYQYVGPDFVSVWVARGPGFATAPIVIPTVNVPAKVDGVEGDFNYHFAPQGNIGGTFSYTDGRVTGGALVPCAGAVSAAVPIATCVGSAMSINPKFIASLHADYAQPVNDRITGFIRGQLTYHGATPTSAAFVAADHAKAYAVANFYVGARSANSNWEATLFVKNLFNNQTRLPAYGGNITAVTPGGQPGGYGPAGTLASNYTYISSVPERQFGITLRYAFGSR